MYDVLYDLIGHVWVDGRGEQPYLYACCCLLIVVVALGIGKWINRVFLR